MDLTLADLVQLGDVPILVLMAWFLYRIDKAIVHMTTRIDTVLEWQRKNGRAG